MLLSYPRIITGDLHANERNGRKRMREVSALITKISEIRERYFAKTLIICGDLFDRNTALAVDSIVTLAQFFRTFENTVLVVGNHDTPVRSSSVTMLDIFKLVGIKIVTETEVIGTDLFVPYYSDVQGLSATSFEHVYMHKDIAELNGYVDVEFGIPLSAIPPCNACFNGHLHTVGKRDLPAGGTYLQLGAPYPTSWSDKAESNNFVWVATQPLEYGTVPVNITCDESNKNKESFNFVRSKTERDVTDTKPLEGIAVLRDSTVRIEDVLAMTNYGKQVNNIIRSAVSREVQQVDAIRI